MWIVSVQRRIIQKSVRFYLLAIAGLLILWQYLRTARWHFFQDTSPFTRYLWYGYYIPIILIPVFAVFIADYVGKAEDYTLPGKRKLLYIPAFLLLGLIFTNDFHQLAFYFPEGTQNYETYSHRAVYCLAVIWEVLLGFLAIGVFLKKCRAPGNRWHQRMPVLILLLTVFFDRPALQKNP